MADKPPSELKFEIGHVLLIDIVGYSKLLINEQRERLQELNELVRKTAQFRATEGSGLLLPIPTGDGMALVFRDSLESPVRCALELGQVLKNHPELKVRMGIHSGPVSEVEDVSERTNIAGAGINMAQRVMDCGDAGHILLSKRVAEDLAQYRQWNAFLHDLGECEVKHGIRLGIVNLYTDEAGNPEVPEKIARMPTTQSAKAIEAKDVISAGRSRLVLVISVLALATALGFWTFRTSQIPKDANAPSSPPATRASVPEKSIAVLPFQNMSEDKQNAYFADGVQEEILTTLAKVADLKVISRTSVMQFRDADKRNLRNIAQQLGVAHVLEGSVQRAANRVRVTAQLIDTRTDAHVWADRYDGELADVFGIQTEIAQKIAGQLKAALSPKEQAALQTKPTTDTAAYDLYLRAREIWRGGVGGGRDSVQKEVTLLDEAVARDPAFVPALCMLARAHLEAYWYNLDHTPARLEQASKALDAAARLQPDAGEVNLSRAVFHYWGSRDYAPALAQLALAARSLPNDSDVLFYVGAIERRQGRWEEAIRTMERALVLDPRNAVLADGQAGNYRALRRYDHARRVRDAVLDWKPDDLGAQILRADVELDDKADLGPLQRVLSGNLPATADQNLMASKRWQVALLQRNYRAAEEALSQYRLEDFPFWGFITPREYFEGRIARGLGDAPRAEAAFLRARERAATAVAERPDDEKALIVLAAIDAKLGRKEEAVREAERAAEMIPVARDALDGPRLLTRLARVYAEVRETDRALDVLQQAVAVPNGPTYGELKLDEDFDPLRRQPRFEKILASAAPGSSSR